MKQELHRGGKDGFVIFPSPVPLHLPPLIAVLGIFSVVSSNLCFGGFQVSCVKSVYLTHRRVDLTHQVISFRDVYDIMLL
jgi:hypothetical protein